MTYTPGPWTIEEYGDDDAPSLVIHKDTETRVCFMATPGSHGDPAAIEEDARLIAAAPEMLAALKNAIEQSDKRQVSVFYGRTPECQDAYDRCIAAIAKAEGRKAE